MNICFYGVGGVGGYYGTLLTKYFNETGKGNTYFIARGKHKDAIVEINIHDQANQPSQKQRD